MPNDIAYGRTKVCISLRSRKSLVHLTRSTCARQSPAIIGAWPKAILLVIFGVVGVSGVGQVLNPRLVGRRAQQSELAMFFALLGGFHAFGGLGIVLGPVLFATAAALIDTLREPVPAAAPAATKHL